MFTLALFDNQTHLIARHIGRRAYMLGFVFSKCVLDCFLNILLDFVTVFVNSMGLRQFYFIQEVVFALIVVS